MTDPFRDAREQLQQEALLRSVDPIPAAQVAYLAAELKRAIGAFELNREQVSLARVPELAPDGRSNEVDPEHVASSEAQLVEAQTWLRDAATRLLEQLDRDLTAKHNRPQDDPTTEGNAS